MSDNDYISRKVTVLSFCAMLSVVLIHSIAILTVEHPAQWNLLCQYLITRSFTYWAVPFFFLMSGYWFARSEYISRGGFKKFAFKKFRTLFIPYVLWVIVGSVAVLPLIVANNYITNHPLLERTFLNTGNAWQIVDSLFAITHFEPMNNGPLWYVRSLLILFAFAPLWRILLRVRVGWVILLALGLTETLFLPKSVGFLALPGMGIGWFALGTVVARRGWDVVRLPRGVIALAGLVWLVASLTKALHAAHVDVCSAAAYGRIVLLIPYGGILFMWRIYDRTILSAIEIKPFYKQTFWVYCAHGALIAWMMGVSRFLLGKRDVATIIVMVISFVFTLAGCYGLARLVKAWSPKVYRVLSGGRG